MNLNEIRTKRPWKRILPNGYLSGGVYTSALLPDSCPVDNSVFRIVTQADFLREYFPSGHIINDEDAYPNIYRAQEEQVLDDEGVPTGRKKVSYYEEKLPRYAFAFQQIISVKQEVHLCGNDIQFEIGAEKEGGYSDLLSMFRQGWLEKDMEVRFSEAVKSVKRTADGAFVGYLDKGVFNSRVFSYLNGDVLYPHYDSSGRMDLFARSYFTYDPEGKEVAEYVEVWDKANFYRFREDKRGLKGVVNRMLNAAGSDGFTLIDSKPHGFPFCPVAYKRAEEGPCWSASQDACDGYEMSFSQMVQNNEATAFPIMCLLGSGSDAMDLQHDLNGTVKVITGSSDAKASYLSAPDASESFMKQLDTLYKMIYEQSFAVIPPELKSGDLPAAALKILYSPAYEKAMDDASGYKPFLNEMVGIFRYGYGVEKEKTIDFASMPLSWWIKPYVHVNESALVADLAAAVQNGFVSKRTASERVQMYSTPSEWDRLIREAKEEQQADLLNSLRKG